MSGPQISRHTFLAGGVGASLLLALVPVTASSASAAQLHTPVPTPLRRADFVFFPSTIFSDPAIKAKYFNYIKRFRVCLTNGYDAFTGRDLAELKRASCDLFFYRWFNGYYETELSDSMYVSYPHVVDGYRVINSHPDWLLNPTNPIQGGGAVTPAFFYDWGNPQLRKYFVDFVHRSFDYTGYNGVFFDYIGDWALPAAILPIWSEKHPDLSYNEAGALFVQELRASMTSEQRIFGNGTYRLQNARTFYESLDFDVTESYGTSFFWGDQATIYLEGAAMTPIYETFYRLWDGDAGYREYIAWPLSEITGAPVEFFEIDYMQPRYAPTGDTVVVDGVARPVFRAETDRAAIYYGYSLSKLNNISNFNSDWYSAAIGLGEVYFSDLGRPLETSYRELPEVVVRYFEKGFVLITRGTDQVSFAPDVAMIPQTSRTLWDDYAGGAVPNWSRQANAVTVNPQTYPATGGHHPSGRVFLYQARR